MPDPPTETEAETPEAARRRARRAARHRRRRRTRRIVIAVVAVSALVGTLADGEPTGLAVADVLYRAGFAAVVTAAASRARRWTWFVLAGAAAAVGSEDLLPLLLGSAGLVVAFASVFRGQRQREVGAAVGLLAAQALLRLPTDLPFAVPSITAALAPLPAYVSALRVVPRLRPYVISIGGLAGVLLVIGAVFGVAMLGIEDRASGGIRAARAGVEAARAGDDSAAESAFAQAEEELASAADTAGAWWLAPARAVPVLAQHVRAVDDVAGEGRALAALSADQVATLDITGLSRVGGGIDLERVAELEPRARTVADALDRAGEVVEDASSPWLVGPAADRLDEFGAEVSSAAPAARTAADALELAPSLLGTDGTRRYIVLVGNPAEARELGGFIGAIGVITADRGSLAFEDVGSPTLVGRAARDAGLAVDTSEFPPPVAASQVNRFPQNWANTADFTATADLAAALAPPAAGGPVDGVLYLDPYAIAALLQLTGPVPIEGRAEPLESADAVDFILREQYLTPEFDSAGERKERMSDAAEATFQRLTTTALPDPRMLADTLSPTVRARRLLFTTTDDGAHELLDRVGLRPPLDTAATDQILVAQQNMRANKLDAYLTRDLDYDVTVDDAGNVTGTLTVELTNSTPEGLDEYVTGDGSSSATAESLPERVNRLSLVTYSALEVLEVTVDAEPTPVGTAPVGDLWRTAVRLSVPADTTVIVTFTLGGVIDPDDYSLDLIPNATAGIDHVTASVDIVGDRRELDRRALDETIRVGSAGASPDH